MKILLVNFTDFGGGAAIASMRLLEGLREQGIEAWLAVTEKKSSSPYVLDFTLKRNFFQKVMNKIYTKYYNFLKKHFKSSNLIAHSFNFSSNLDVKKINSFDCDIVNLHWIGGDRLAPRDMAKINKPIVWTMHDSWPCCGAEHHPNIIENDTRWQFEYTKENKPKSTKGFDLCRKTWLQKKKYLSNKKIIFTAPSNWECNILKTSSLFSRNDCFVIPNLINQNIFSSKDKNLVRNLFGIPLDKKIIGFGAAYDIDNPKSMKGSYFLVDALNKLKNPQDYFLVIFGPAGEKFTSQLDVPFFASGYISNTNIMALLYNACDVFINPSLIENLPTTSLESLCCGVPIVSFDVGGSKDIVEHKTTGYLAEPYESSDLVNGIEYCLQNKEKLSENCLEKAKKDFSSEESVKKYIKVYNYAIKFEKQK